MVVEVNDPIPEVFGEAEQNTANTLAMVTDEYGGFWPAIVTMERYSWKPAGSGDSE